MIQGGYIFLLEHLHEEKQLIDYISRVCERPISDDDGAVDEIKNLLKSLMLKGDDACRDFLDNFRICKPLFFSFSEAVQSVIKRGMSYKPITP